MTITIENFANFDQKFDVINNLIILLSIKDTCFGSILAQQWLQMGIIGKFEKILTSGLVYIYLVAIPIPAMSVAKETLLPWQQGHTFITLFFDSMSTLYSGTLVLWGNTNLPLTGC